MHTQVGCVPVSLLRSQLAGQYRYHLPPDPYDETRGVAYLLPEEVTCSSSSIYHMAFRLVRS